MKIKTLQFRAGHDTAAPSGKGPSRLRWSTEGGISVHLLGDMVALVEEGAADALLFPVSTVAWARVASDDVLAEVTAPKGKR